MIALLEALGIQNGAEVGEHGGAAAQHEAVALGVDRRQGEGVGHPVRREGQRQPALMAKGFARHGRIVEEFFAHEFADQLVVRQVVHEIVAIGEVFHPAHPVRDDDPVELVVSLRVADDAEERREPGAGAEQEQGPAGLQVVDDQGAGRLAADQNLVAFLEVLEARGQRTVGDLDAEELELVIVMRARQRIGAQHRLPSPSRPIITNCPLRKRKDGVRVVRKLNRRSVQ